MKDDDTLPATKTTSEPGFLIPKIFHQTWRTPDIGSHSKFAPVSKQSIVQNHPDWEYRFWTDDEIAKFIKSQFGWFFDCWTRLNANIKRIDAARYCWLYQMGGVYADLDVILFKNIEPILSGSGFMTYVSAQAINERWQFAGNAFMGSRKEHPIWTMMLEHIVRYPQRDTSDIEVLKHTGPLGLGAVLDAYVREHGDSEIQKLSPQLFGNSDEPPYSYGCHLRTHNWDAPTPSRIRRRIRKWLRRI